MCLAEDKLDHHDQVFIQFHSGEIDWKIVVL
jgi:hypothetical protein